MPCIRVQKQTRRKYNGVNSSARQTSRADVKYGGLQMPQSQIILIALMTDSGFSVETGCQAVSGSCTAPYARCVALWMMAGVGVSNPQQSVMSPTAALRVAAVALGAATVPSNQQIHLPRSLCSPHFTHHPSPLQHLTFEILVPGAQDGATNNPQSKSHTNYFLHRRR